MVMVVVEEETEQHRSRSEWYEYNMQTAKLAWRLETIKGRFMLVNIMYITHTYTMNICIQCMFAINYINASCVYLYTFIHLINT